ncbi:MAG: bifunctional riboflavin kinase/FAD synthetase [Candidatus Omnitrophica bacterium]|nr:bifunctional riboflavin kinase/FAD synthetase [Candidatus Omnitrophota bacterium]
MKVTYGIGKVKPPSRPRVLAIGVFDGGHRGHQALIRAAVAQSRRIGGECWVMTFWPHPFKIIHPEISHPYLMSLDQRLQWLAELGVDQCLVAPFTRRFARLDPQTFIRNYLAHKIRPVEVYVGFDFRFGHDREGTLAVFKKAGSSQGFKVDVVHCVGQQHHKISRSRIRQLMAGGELKNAARLLGRPFAVTGRVRPGDRRGASLGFPTANMDPRDVVLPPNGVYCVHAGVKGKKYPAIANVGIRPTIRRTAPAINIETYILNFHQPLYGQTLQVEFLHYLRPEKKFASLADLVSQMRLDEEAARRYFHLSPA